ncbi:MAG: hypothetical protein J5556_01500 [Deltaproteobacteria bacterium]|nr:hypothetical protein [Deltaproteobacteria bacterium]
MIEEFTDGTLEEKIKNAIDLMAAMVVEELAADEHRDACEVLSEFMSSDTAKLLYDESSKLWWSGPSDIAEQYRNELSRKHVQRAAP